MKKVKNKKADKKVATPNNDNKENIRTQHKYDYKKRIFDDQMTG